MATTGTFSKEDSSTTSSQQLTRSTQPKDLILAKAKSSSTARTSRVSPLQNQLAESVMPSAQQRSLTQASWNAQSRTCLSSRAKNSFQLASLSTTLPGQSQLRTLSTLHMELPRSTPTVALKEEVPTSLSSALALSQTVTQNADLEFPGNTK